MAKKSTKNGYKTKLSRRQRQRRQEKLVSTLIYAFLAICVASFAAIGVSNAADSRADRSEWIVQEGQMEILAAPAASMATPMKYSSQLM